MATTEQAGYAPHAEKDAINGASAHHGHGHGHHGHGNNHGGWSGPEGASLHPGVFKPYEHRKFANPAPLGLSAFALTTFVLSAINMGARGVEEPTVVVPLAFGYGGLVQLLAGMWEMAVGNTFGATALSSYGGFWIAYALLLTPTWGIMEESGPYMGKPNCRCFRRQIIEAIMLVSLTTSFKNFRETKILNVA